MGQTTTRMFDTFSRPIAVQNPLGNVGSTIYDNYDRVWYQVDALGNCVTNGFDGSAVLWRR